MEVTMSGQCVVAVFDSMEHARFAMDELRNAGLESKVTVVARKPSDARKVSDALPEDNLEPVSDGQPAGYEVLQGVTAGGLLGFLLAAPILMVPGLGPVLVAGPMAGALTGAIVGGFLKGMGAWGVRVDHADEYERKLQSGALLLVVTGAPDDVARAKRLLDQSEASEVELHATSADTPVSP
jgi:hypothetical protein